MENLTPQTIDKIIEVKESRPVVEIVELHGHTYTTDTLMLVEPPMYRPEPITVYGLDSICKLIRNEIDAIQASPVYVRVKSHDKIDVITTFGEKLKRDTLYVAEADVPGFREGYRDYEKAAIELRSLFIPGEGVDYLIDLLSRIRKEDSVTSEDNGVTQEVTVKQGVNLKAYEKVNPRVKLQPFRTFIEVDQPESEFLLRVDDNGNIGIFEADGGVWKLEAKQNASAYFEENLSDLVESGRVVVMR